MSLNPYKELGVPPDADEATINKRFRDLAKKHHPDVKGGNEEKFKKLSKSREILCNKDLRDAFDATGVADATTEEEKIQLEAVQQLKNLFISFLAQTNEEKLKTTNVIRELTEHLRKYALEQERMKETQKAYVEQQDKILAVLEKRLKRRRRKKKVANDNVLLQAFRDMVKKAPLVIKNIEHNIEVAKVAIKMLNEFTYDTDPPYGPTAMGYSGMPFVTFRIG